MSRNTIITLTTIVWCFYIALLSVTKQITIGEHLISQGIAFIWQSINLKNK